MHGGSNSSHVHTLGNEKGENMNVSECCGSIPWNDTHTCFECGKYAKFINHIKYRSTNMNERILKMIEGRLEDGERKYGHENVEHDGRDFTTEALEEALDCAVYLAAKLIEIQTRKVTSESNA